MSEKMGRTAAKQLVNPRQIRAVKRSFDEAAMTVVRTVSSAQR